MKEQPVYFQEALSSPVNPILGRIPLLVEKHSTNKPVSQRSTTRCILQHDLSQFECVGRVIKLARKYGDKEDTCAAVQQCGGVDHQHLLPRTVPPLRVLSARAQQFLTIELHTALNCQHTRCIEGDGHWLLWSLSVDTS